MVTCFLLASPRILSLTLTSYRWKALAAGTTAQRRRPGLRRASRSTRADSGPEARRTRKKRSLESGNGCEDLC